MKHEHEGWKCLINVGLEIQYTNHIIDNGNWANDKHTELWTKNYDNFMSKLSNLFR